MCAFNVGDNQRVEAVRMNLLHHWSDLKNGINEGNKIKGQITSKKYSGRQKIIIRKLGKMSVE
jgi:hypothetical protein